MRRKTERKHSDAKDAPQDGKDAQRRKDAPQDGKEAQRRKDAPQDGEEAQRRMDATQDRKEEQRQLGFSRNVVEFGPRNENNETSLDAM